MCKNTQKNNMAYSENSTYEVQKAYFKKHLWKIGRDQRSGFVIQK